MSDKLRTLGRWFLAVAVICSGVQQVVIRHFVRLVPKLPDWVSGQEVWAAIAGVVLVAIGAAMLAGRGARAASAVLAALLFLLFLLLYLPAAAANPLAGFMWTNPAKTLALCGGALVIAATTPTKGGNANPVITTLERVAPALLGAFLFICGAQHFVYAGFVDTLVPAWIPPNPRFWTCFAGIALMAGGVGVVLPATRRWAGVLSGLMIFLWIVLLHIPRAAADWNNAGETSAIFEALALSGVALLVGAKDRK